MKSMEKQQILPKESAVFMFMSCVYENISLTN